MEIWLTVLIIAVVLMAATLALLPRLEHREKRPGPGSGSKAGPGAGRSRYRPALGGAASAGAANYALAPKHPDVMAGALFELLSRKLSFKEITAFVDLVISPELTARYIDRLSAKSSLAGFAEGLAYLCNSMEANGFTEQQRARVAQALLHKARKEYKLLEIQKNLEDLF